MEKVRKKREEVEMRYLGEYIAKFHPHPVRVFIQPPVSAKPFIAAAHSNGKDAKWFWRYGPRADAVVVEKDQLVIIETETRRPVTGLSELELYAAHLHENPMFGPYLRLPKVFELVSPIVDEHVMRLCAQKGIKYIVFTPQWIVDHLRRWGVMP